MAWWAFHVSTLLGMLWVVGGGFRIWAKRQQEQRREVRMEQLLSELHFFESQMVGNVSGVLERMAVSFPLPLWCKDYRDGSGRMLFCSDEYLKVWALEPDDYIGKTDADVWGEEVAREYRRRDMEVLRTGKVVVDVEPSPGAKVPGWDSVHVYKWLVMCDDERGLVFGLALPAGETVSS